MSNITNGASAHAVNHGSARSRILDDYGDGDEDEDRFQEDFMMDWI
jgi:hypothetical protein